MVEAIERVLFDWPLRLFSKTRVQIGPLKYRVKRDGVIVCYSLVDQYLKVARKSRLLPCSVPPEGSVTCSVDV